jgi:hypothetical protein
MSASAFLEQTNDRRLGPDYAGHVLIWDIDKTYLDTRFSSFRGLISIPFEFAIDKRAIPGAAPLLRALRRGPGAKSALVPLYFISGSPPQLRPVIERKMTLDGVEFDGITFKDQLGLLLKGRVRALRAQVGYKLRALLLYRRELPDRARYLLFGDDVEEDAASFILFGAICAGLRERELARELESAHVNAGEIDAILGLAHEIPESTDPVDRIFIHLERNTDPSSFTDPRVVSTRSFLQTAMVLAASERVRPDAVVAVAKDLRLRHVPEETIRLHIEDAMARLSVPVSIAALARQT